MQKGSNILLVFILLGFIIMLSGCNKKTNKETTSSIKLDEEQHIEQLKSIKIDDTDDTITITSKVKWKVPKESDEDTTVSFSIAIPYSINIDGKEYEGIYQLNNDEWSKSDDNPKYKFKVVNLTKDGDLSIYMTNK